MPEPESRQITERARASRPKIWGAAATSALTALVGSNSHLNRPNINEIKAPTPIAQSAAAASAEKAPPHKGKIRKPPRIIITKPPVNQDITPTTEGKGLLNLHPENLSVPTNVQEIMRQNVVYIPETMCSGFLIRDENNIPIGVITAAHCDLLASEKFVYADKDGQQRVHFARPMDVYTGDDVANLHDAGQITQFIISPSDNTKDVALGVLSGHEPEEVVARYAQVSISDITSLKEGDVIYNSGWPVDQPHNKGPMARQVFAMSVLGTANWAVTSGQQLQLLIAAVPTEAQTGTECSWGNSGSAAFTVDQNGNPIIIGTASAFNDFGQLYNKDKPEAAKQEQDYIISAYNADMTGYAGVCGFSYEKPSLDTSQVVPIVSQ